MMRNPMFNIFFVILANISLFSIVNARRFCLNNSNYTNDTTYQANLNTLLSNMSTNLDGNGFYYASVGQEPDRANAIALCRGDIELEACRTCVQTATITLVQVCPNYRQAAHFNSDEMCILRYSDHPIYGILGRFAIFVRQTNTLIVTSPFVFMADLNILLDNIRDQASRGGSLRKVAAGNISSADSQIISGMVQCSPDLSSQACTSCLTTASLELPISNGAIGARIVQASCHLRYEIRPFFNATMLQGRELVVVQRPPAPPQQQPRLGNARSNTTKSRTTIIILVSVFATIFMIIALIVGFLKRKGMRLKPKKEAELDDISTAKSLQYDFGLIRAATNDFCEENKLGQGGFGAVYQGKLPNGQELAVKRLSKDSVQGDLEFKNEVMLLAKLQHKNLVRLLGFSLEGQEKLLIYELVQNASLNKFLFDPIKRSNLDWKTRYKIIGGIAKGILYMHEDSRLTIIHRDLKADNILLDGEMNPKIADFGTARLFVLDALTHVTTSKVVGTYGYMAPEYLQGKFSVKSDVFSFGVLLMEIISGRRNNSNGESEDLISSAWELWRRGSAANLVDPMLRDGSNIPGDALRCIHIGLLCIQQNAADRPTIGNVVLMLGSSTITLPLPVEPAVHNLETQGAPKLGDDASQNKMSVSEYDGR